MRPFRPLSAQIQVSLALFASFVFAVLQNVTVDDAVLTGAVVPQYLPFGSVWNQGNNCTICLVQPDPSQAYNGTWHDTTYNSSSGFTQVIEFTFTGSALYIFFIIANTASGDRWLTNVQFTLDGNLAGTYSHDASTSTDYEYNVPVYANDSLALGPHQMTIQPINSGNNNVLILFDYLIYTVDVSNSSSSGSGTVTSSSSTNIGAILGGTLGGTALVVIAALLLCYCGPKRGCGGRPSGEEGFAGNVPSHDRLNGRPALRQVSSRSEGAVSITTAVTPQPDAAAPSDRRSVLSSENLINLQDGSQHGSSLG